MVKFKRRKQIKKATSDQTDHQTEFPTPFLVDSINKRKSNKSSAYTFTSLYEITKKVYPDDYSQIPFQLLRQPRLSKSGIKSRFKFKRRKAANKSSVTEPPSEPAPAPPSEKSPAVTSSSSDLEFPSKSVLDSSQKLSLQPFSSVLPTISTAHLNLNAIQPQRNLLLPSSVPHEAKTEPHLVLVPLSEDVKPPELSASLNLLSSKSRHVTFHDDDLSASDLCSLAVVHSSDYEEVEVEDDDTTQHTTDLTTEDEEQFEEDNEHSLDPIKLGSILNSLAFRGENLHTEYKTDPSHPDETFRNLVHHSGMKKIWAVNDSEPLKNLKPGEAIGVNKIFPPAFFEKLSPIERRVRIEGQKFRVAMNERFQGSLYRAVARAATGSESNFKIIRTDILQEILTNWSDYLVQMIEFSGFNNLHLPSESKPKVLLDRFKTNFISKTSGSPLFELWAAAKKYGFNFVLIDANCYDGQGTVLNSSTMDVMNDPLTIVYHFLRTGILQDSWCYEFLIPLGPPEPIQDGYYPLSMVDVLLVDRQTDNIMTIKMRNDDPFMPRLTQKPITGFGLDQRLFLYIPTKSHDLWSLLSELIHQNLFHAPHIYESTLWRKLNEHKLYHYSKLKKKRKKGRGCEKDLRSRLKAVEASLQLTNSQKGSPTDLEYAAGHFKFSYTLIGLDINGNFFWKESIAEPEPGGLQVEMKYFALFVKFLRNREPYWYALEDVIKDCPNEMKISQNFKAFQDLLASRSWKRFYHAEPCMSLKNGTLKSKSKWGLNLNRTSTENPWVQALNQIITTPSELGSVLNQVNTAQSQVTNTKSESNWALVLSRVNTGRRWVVKELSQIMTKTRINTVAKYVTDAFHSLFSRLRGIFNSFRAAVRVHPVDKSIRQLYFRDNP